MVESGVTFIHRLALVDDSVKLGRGTKVWQFASVIRNSIVGANCNIATCSIVDGSRLGDNVIVSHGAFIDPGIVIDSDVFIGPGVKLCNDAWPRVEKSGFDIAVMIKGGFEVTRIEAGASLGAGVIVLPGLVIGAGAMVAAGSVVTQNVPAGCLHKRNGNTARIDEDRPIQRMRSCSM